MQNSSESVIKKFKILIVSESFYPDNSPRSFRTTELVKEFCRIGYSVTVITHFKAGVHDEFSERHGFTIKDLGKRNHSGVEIRGKGPIRIIRRLTSRLLLLLFEYPAIELVWLVKRALKYEGGYDLLISIAVPYPVHWGVAAIRSRKHDIARVWVADCGDPYVGRENDTFSVPFYFRFVEKWFMRKADYISVPTNGAVSAYFPEFHNKIRVISQGFNFQEYNFDSNPAKNSCPTFAYAGMFIPGRRDPSEFIEFLQMEEMDYRFHIYTKTPQHIPEIKGTARSKIVIHKPIPRQELLVKLHQMDFLVNFENVGLKQVPSKTIDYLIIDKPVLSIRTGFLNKEIVREFLSGNYAGRLIIDNPEQYRIENVCKKFLQLVDPL